MWGKSKEAVTCFLFLITQIFHNPPGLLRTGAHVQTGLPGMLSGALGRKTMNNF